MAERRMFAKTIIDSDIFIDMPTSSRLLYYDLSMRADDDGFVNSPKKIMRMTGASDDDLKMLIAKSFLLPFESGVVVIKHWKIHNYIRGDRYTPTICRAEKECLTLTDTKEYVIQDGIPLVDHMTYQRDTQVRLGKDSIGKDSIGKDSIGKDSIGKDSIGDIQEDCKQSKRPPVPFEEIKEYFNRNCTGFPSIREMTDKRKNAIRSFLKNHTEEDLYQLFTMAQSSDFLTGENKNGWRADFDWILKPSNAIKIFEGNYKNKLTKKDATMNEYHRLLQKYSDDDETGNKDIFAGLL